jgi:hypothetical protein
LAHAGLCNGLVRPLTDLVWTVRLAFAWFGHDLETMGGFASSRTKDPGDELTIGWKDLPNLGRGIIC